MILILETCIAVFCAALSGFDFLSTLIPPSFIILFDNHGKAVQCSSQNVFGLYSLHTCLRCIPAEAAEQYLATGTGLIIQQAQGDSHGENLAIWQKFRRAETESGLSPPML